MKLQHTKTAMEAVKVIPPERFWSKVRRTGLGAVFIGGAAYMAVGLAVSPWAYVPLGLFGAHIISAELVEKAARFVLAMLKDVLNAMRGARA